MEQPNVNNLNGVPNFGEGFPEDITSDNETVDEKENEEREENVPGDGSEAEKDNG